MNCSVEEMAAMLETEQFPLSSKYDPVWVLENEMEPSALWLTEWLCQAMDLKPGMRVLDMGCGKAMSSIFLAKEFGVQVWATDLWVEASENWKRIREARVEDKVYPIYAEAHSLPYPEEFFDVIVSLDSYQYYGTDDLYLSYVVKYLRPSGQIGIVVPGLMRDFRGPVPEHLTRRQKSGGVFWGQDCWCFHSANWWLHLWDRTGLVEVELADTIPEGWRLWLQFERARDALGNRRFPSDVEVLEADGGRYLGFVRMVARRKERSDDE
jgi:SAM-dependent methyltransferase